MASFERTLLLRYRSYGLMRQAYLAQGEEPIQKVQRCCIPSVFWDKEVLRNLLVHLWV